MRLLMFSLFLSLSSMLLCLISIPAHAQLDPSTEVLLNSNLNEDQKAGLQSGRYEIHPTVDDDGSFANERTPAQENPSKTTTTSAAKSTASSNEADFKIKLKKKKVAKKKSAQALPGKKISGEEKQMQDPIEGVTVVTPATMPVIPQPARPPLAVVKAQAAVTTTSTTLSTTTSTSTTLPTKVAEAVPAAVPIPSPAEPAIPEPVPVKIDETPSWKEQLKELVYAPPTEIQEYKERIHPDDNRLNQIEINLMPGVMSVNSKSNLDYRDYKTTAPAWLLGGEFWLTPFMGVYGSYTSTIGGDVIGDPSTNSHVSAQHEWTEIGFDLRKYFGMSRKANSVTFGVDYTSYKFTVPSDSTYREDLSSNAIGFHVQARMPVAPNYAWTFGARVAPRVNISEKNTALDLSSGSSPQAIRLGANVGGEFKLSREHQLIWQLSISYEKAKYGDQSSLPDPNTGSVVNGVSVDSTTTFLQFGYRWGQ